jgi:hypothetical protein
MGSGQDGKTGFRRGAASNRRGRGGFAPFVLTVLLVAVAATAARVRADQYWISYEGNDLPEKAGWSRYSSGPGVKRWLDDGRLLVDSRSDPLLTEIYTTERKGAVDPGVGETFVASWRLLAEDVHLFGATLAITSDNSQSVYFIFDESMVVSARQPNLRFVYEPLVFHEFELRSDDMREYQLYVDGAPAFEGQFSMASTASWVAFGDMVVGGSGLVSWDHVRFGVVPEPSACVIVLGLFLGHQQKLRVFASDTRHGARKCD